jgi:hypothetical protein
MVVTTQPPETTTDPTCEIIPGEPLSVSQIEMCWSTVVLKPIPLSFVQRDVSQQLRNHRYRRPVSFAGKTHGPVKWSPVIPAHMFNASCIMLTEPALQLNVLLNFFPLKRFIEVPDLHAVDLSDAYWRSEDPLSCMAQNLETFFITH